MIEDINLKFKNYKPYINGAENYKCAAITLPLVNYMDSLHILFEVRAKSLTTQPNEICFPGGKIEGNETPLNTALRETYEEIGIPQSKMNVISPLDLFISPFDIIIHPYLILIEDINDLNINKSEVEETFLVPLDFFIENDPKLFKHKLNVIPNTEFPYDIIPQKSNYQFATGIYETYFYIYNKYVIWGITAKILNNFITKLK